MGDERNWLSKRGVGGGNFQECRENADTSHAVSLALFVSACNNSALVLMSCACLSEAHNYAS